MVVVNGHGLEIQNDDVSESKDKEICQRGSIVSQTSKAFHIHVRDVLLDLKGYIRC